MLLFVCSKKIVFYLAFLYTYCDLSLYLGVTGVGKTEIANQVAEHYRSRDATYGMINSQSLQNVKADLLAHIKVWIPNADTKSLETNNLDKLMEGCYKLMNTHLGGDVKVLVFDDAEITGIYSILTRRICKPMSKNAGVTGKWKIIVTTNNASEEIKRNVDDPFTDCVIDANGFSDDEFINFFDAANVQLSDDDRNLIDTKLGRFCRNPVFLRVLREEIVKDTVRTWIYLFLCRNLGMYFLGTSFK